MNASLSSPPSRFEQHWAAEAIRLQELHAGPLDDGHEAQQALTQAQGFADRLLHRATALGEREGLFAAMQRWRSMARFSAMLLGLMASLAGGAAALGVLGPTEREINILLAMVALLGLPTLTLIFWVISLILPSGSHHGGLGQIWFWMSEQLSHRKSDINLTRALVSLLSRHRLLQPLLGTISHAFWLLALLITTLSVTGLLSARRYTFNWETTLLSPDAFVKLTTLLGKPLSMLGLNGPQPDMVRLSDGLHTLPDSVHLQWSAWLIGCLLCYGLLPRLIALMATLWQLQRRLAHLTLDTRLPGYAELRSRLEPVSLPAGIDSPAPASLRTPAQAAQHHANAQGQAILGIELSPDQPWPPAPPPSLPGLPDTLRNLGVVDTWSQRQQALSQLQSRPPRKLLIACDGRQTPDRGTIMLIKQLASLAHTTHIMLPVFHSPGAPVPADRIPVWHTSLTEAGVPADHIHSSPESAWIWLTEQP